MENLQFQVSLLSDFVSDYREYLPEGRDDIEERYSFLIDRVRDIRTLAAGDRESNRVTANEFDNISENLNQIEQNINQIFQNAIHQGAQDAENPVVGDPDGWHLHPIDDAGVEEDNIPQRQFQYDFSPDQLESDEEEEEIQDDLPPIDLPSDDEDEDRGPQHSAPAA
jgi:hypothetical protein